MPETPSKEISTVASTSNQKYIDNLMLALRIRNVPGGRIGQIVAEVEAHLAESGEDPVDAFGKPSEYAKAWADDAERSLDWTKRIRYILGVAAAGAGGFLAALGGIRTATGETLWGLHAIFPLLVGVVLTVASAFITPLEHKIVDPRTGREPERLRRMGRRALVILGAVVLLFVGFAVVASIAVE